MQKNMQTSKQPTFQPYQAKLIFSPEGSHASHIAQPESDLEAKMTATSGRKCLESFGRLPRVGLWAKTFAGLLVGMEGWSSTRCRLTWKLRGTKLSRFYFQLAASTRHTKDTEFGLLHTPRAVMIVEEPEWFQKRMGDRNGTTYPNLAVQVLHTPWLLKTPTAFDATVSSGKKNPVPGDSGCLAQEIMSGYAQNVRGLLPTPAAQDGDNSTLPPSKINRDTVPGAIMRLLPTPQAGDGYKGCSNQHQDSLHKTFKTGGDSQLNPRFVGEMMGFPANWLELPFQLTGENP